MNSMMNDSLTGIRVVKAFAKEDAETHRFYEYSSRLYKANLKVNAVSIWIFPVISIPIGASCHAVWGPGGYDGHPRSVRQDHDLRSADNLHRLHRTDLLPR